MNISYYRLSRISSTILIAAVAVPARPTTKYIQTHILLLLHNITTQWQRFRLDQFVIHARVLCAANGRSDRQTVPATAHARAKPRVFSPPVTTRARSYTNTKNLYTYTYIICIYKFIHDAHVIYWDTLYKFEVRSRIFIPSDGAARRFYFELNYITNADALLLLLW